jgi:hypothetical protein
MVGSLVVVLIVAAVAISWWIRSALRRRAAATLVVPTWPEIELSEPYGGWNAGAYDARTGRDRCTPGEAALPTAIWLAPHRTR